MHKAGRLGVMALALAALLFGALQLEQCGAEQGGVPVAAARTVPALPAARTGVVASAHAALVVDRALLDLLHGYLLEQAGPARADALRLHLRQTLTPEAYREAAALVDRYLAYMAAHDALLAVHNITNNDLRRVAIWCDQRDRLRQRMLGAAVTQAWYRQEDAQLKRIFDTAPGADAGPYELLTQIALDQAVTSFATLAREGPSWALRHAAYLEAKSRITRNTGLDDAERSMQIRELLLRSFSSESDRYRARLLEND
jgi:lipase chaperone LimK